MPRSLIRGPQVLDGSIESEDLAKDSVITEKIKDGNVTCIKLEPGLCDRLFSNSNLIGRIKIAQAVPEDTDFLIPGELTYDLETFVKRVHVFRNGLLLYTGQCKPVDLKDPIEVYPGSTNQHIKFCLDLVKGDVIQVLTL
jgi:hypothetical protein